jgi:hypothetical protein
MPKLKNEDEILSPEVRKAIIKEITTNPENLTRKFNALRKHEIFRDLNSKWVMDALQKEGFKQTTIEQMRNRASNVSVARKIINKLSQTYVGGVERKAKEAADQESLDAICNYTDANGAMKKSDQYRQLFRNALLQIVPRLNTQETRKAGGEEKYELCFKVLSEWEYDVVEDYYDKTKPMVVVLTDFVEQNQFASTQGLVAGAQGRRSEAVFTYPGNQVDEIIADSAADEGNEDRTFIFWSDSYHFTCNIDGDIIDSPDGGENPIQQLPFVNLAWQQDGHFWAKGGDDVVEGSVLINKKLTDTNFIQFVQGWGQLVIAAKDVPKKIVGGPDNAFIFDVQANDPTPQVFYASSNPDIESWLRTIELTVAMLLSTNNLSTRNISTKLDTSNPASGVSILIDNAELVSDQRDVQQFFQQREPKIWEIFRLWHQLYYDRQALVTELQEIAPMKSGDVSLKFLSVKPPMSDKERLEEMKLRKDLGIATLKDLLKMDNPDLTDEQLDAKLEEVQDEKAKAAEEAAKVFASQTGKTIGVSDAPPGQMAKHDKQPENKINDAQKQS